MRVVLDTNVLLPALFRISRYNVVYRKLLDGIYELCVTTEIIHEYEEVITDLINRQTALNVIRSLRDLENVEAADVYYKWNLITNDPDDNKFVDCAVAANADFLVSNDTDFNVLKKVGFPIVNVITGPKFLKMLK